MQRFRHYACKLRIMNDNSESNNALTQNDLERIQQISFDNGISITHVITSLVKKSLNIFKQEEESNAKNKTIETQN